MAPGDWLISAEREVQNTRLPSVRSRAGRWTWWAIASGAALLAASQWLHAPSVEYLVPFVIATAAALGTAFVMTGPARWWARACSLALGFAAAMALPAQRELIRVSHDWDAWRRETATHALDALKHGLDDAIDRMTIDTRAPAKAA